MRKEVRRGLLIKHTVKDLKQGEHKYLGTLENDEIKIEQKKRKSRKRTKECDKIPAKVKVK